MIPFKAPFLGSSGITLSGHLLDDINTLGISSGLKLCLDTGDSNCYSGTGQTFTDISGNGNNFLRGATSSSEATDPTFLGSAGSFGNTGFYIDSTSDRFTYNTTNPTWMNNLHKDGAKFALVFGVIQANTTAGNSFIYTSGDIVNTMNGANTVSGNGVRLGWIPSPGGKGAPGGIVMAVGNGSSGIFYNMASWPAFGAPLFTYHGFIIMDEAAGTLHFGQAGSLFGGTQVTVTSFTSQSYTSPSSSAASTMQIFRNVAGAGGSANTRLSLTYAAMWEGANIPTYQDLSSLISDGMMQRYA